MTFEDFKQINQDKNAFHRYWHYGVAIAFGLFSLFGIFFVIFLDNGKFHSMGYVVHPALLLILSMSLSAFYLLPNRYKIVEITSTLSMDVKRKLVNSIISEYCGLSNENATNYVVCYLNRRWWQSRYRLHFYFDDSRYAFSLQGYDRDGGWIDFGETERKRRELMQTIKNLSSQ